jgi:hypothetical protein
MNTNYIYTDIGFCHLFRPIIKKAHIKPKRFLDFQYKSQPYNSLFVKSGCWTARMHQVLDLLYHQKSNEIDIKNIKTDIRRDVLKNLLKNIAEFEFAGQRYNNNELVYSPILMINGNAVTLKYEAKKVVRIPVILYTLNPYSQFLYRRFFAHMWTNKSGTYNLKTFIDYLNLEDENYYSNKRVLKYLNELAGAKLIKMPRATGVKEIKILKTY